MIVFGKAASQTPVQLRIYRKCLFPYFGARTGNSDWFSVLELTIQIGLAFMYKCERCCNPGTQEEAG